MFLENIWQKIKNRPRIRRNLIFLSILILALVITWSTINVIVGQNEPLQKKIDDEIAEIERLKKENQQLEAENDFLQSQAGSESLLREQSGQVAPGESKLLYQKNQIEKIRETYQSQRPDPQKPAVVLSNWQLWWNLFWGETPE